MGFKDSNWICPSIPHSHIWIIKQDLWKAKPCVWKTLCELFMRSSFCLPIHPGAMCLPSLTWLLNYLLSFLPFSVSLIFHCLVSVLVLFFPPECWHNALPPHSLCTPSSTLSSYLPVSPHSEGILGKVLVPDPDFETWVFCSGQNTQKGRRLLSSSSLVK